MSCFLIILKLSFSFLVYYSNCLNSIILPFIHMLILLAILVSSLIKICHLHNISLLFLNHAFTIFLTYVRYTIDQTTVCNIATSLIHSKIDYCNSLLLNLPGTQTNDLHLVLISAVTKTRKCHYITLILNSFHWLFANGCIQLQQMLNRQPRTWHDYLCHSSNTR